MKEIDIEMIIPLLRGPAWVAMDRDGEWNIYYGDTPPCIEKAYWWYPRDRNIFGFSSLPGEPYKFKIKPVKDWTKSLRRIEK